MMTQRRSKFESKFRNVWASGATGTSLIFMTTAGNPETLVRNLFRETMVADVVDTQDHVRRSFTKHGRLDWNDYRHRLTMVTSDDRVAEVIEEVAKWTTDPVEEHTPFDLVVVPMATGSKDYINWVKLQTLKKDDSTAFFNQDAGAKMSAITTTAEDKENQKDDKTNV